MFLICSLILNAQVIPFGFIFKKGFVAIPTGVNPVTAGLILYLDATRIASYGGSGTTWYDLSGTSNTATLVGSPVYGIGNLSNGSGSFTFGSNINASTLNNNSIATSITYIAWINPTQNQTNESGIISRRTSSGNGLTCLSINSSNAITYSWDNQYYAWTSNLSAPLNKWSMAVISINSNTATAYLCNENGISSASNSSNNYDLSTRPTTNFYIACDPYDKAARSFKGKIATAMVYTNTLSLAEITSIFNAQKASFGL